MKTLEEEARNFCEKTDKEIGEYWSNDYDELPLQIERFVMESKWIQTEKIKSQIEAVRAVDTYGIKHMLEYYEQQLKELEDEGTL